MTATVNQGHIWKQEKQALFFLLKLLFLLSSVKFLFFVFNRSLLRIASENAGIRMIGWSFYYDLLIILAINIPFLLILWICRRTGLRKMIQPVTAIFIFLNFFCLVLNIADIPYFHFHSQRADADLLYVLQDPLQKTFVRNPMITIAAVSFGAGLLYIVYRIHKKLLTDHDPVQKYRGLIIIIAGLLFLITVSRKKYIPTYPLTSINSSELQVVQNSFHTFLYSLFRNRDGMVRPYNFLNNDILDKLIPTKHHVKSGQKKNVVLFIMESIPADYFDSSSKYKVTMPFFDSLLLQSTHFSNAYSYSHHSNKGIVAILAGLPTLTEIPLYHSKYSDMARTSIGDVLKKNQYTSSLTIGDNYDDFGFAKCCNWLGIEKYYCKDDMTGKYQFHTMGVHDEFVLDFFGNKLSQTKEPFFSVQYNISTHYPYDRPKSYVDEFKQQNFSPGMKSMHYYSECMRTFFNNAVKQSWYNNTVFIFCSDHWLFPDERDPAVDVLQRFRIPIFIFDPSVNKKEIISTPVSQLDIMNTVLSYSGVNDTVISYGRNLLDTLAGRIVFMRENSTLYQAVDSSYVLGFNPVNNKVEFLYDHKKDPLKKNALSADVNNRLLLSTKAFLQKASLHYNKKIN